MNPALTALGAALVGGLLGGALVLTTVEGPQGPPGPPGPAGQPASKLLSGTHVLVHIKSKCPAGTVPIGGEVVVNTQDERGQALFALCRVR